LRRASSTLAVLLLAGIGTLLYATRLGDVPAYVMHDEAQGALQAHSIATTAHDLSGRLLPMYFTEPEFVPGRDPLLVYYTAAALTVAPFTEAGVRAPTAVLAVLNVILTFVVARALFQSTAMGTVAAVMLLLTPVHFIRGRLLLSPLYTIPFILGWLWALTRFETLPTTRRLVGAAVPLALGMYSYLAAVVMMPVYLLVTLAIAFAKRLQLRQLAIAAAVFGLLLLPMAAWYVTHPERNAQIVSAYQLDEANAQVPVARWIHNYWSFFDPSFLFVSGDSSLINSTRMAGFFPMAFAVLLPVGIYGLMRAGGPLPTAVAVGLLTAPLVSIISGSIEMNRIMFAIPFGVLTAAYGAHVLLRAGLVARVVAVLLLVSIPWQFSHFYRGYMGAYRVTSAPWFAGHAREALLAAMDQAESTTGPIYVSSEIDWVHRTWRFYAIASGRPGMIERARFVYDVPPDAVSGATLVCPTTTERCRGYADAGWTPVRTVASIDGSREFLILRR
jgi:4-amino-4-deoxy-L-arabinose transferase-like glycosyltransferase